MRPTEPPTEGQPRSKPRLFSHVSSRKAAKRVRDTLSAQSNKKAVVNEPFTLRWSLYPALEPQADFPKH